MPDTKREEKNQKSSTTKSYGEKLNFNDAENKGTEQKPITLDDRLTEMESESIKFPNTSAVSASVTKTQVMAKVSDVTTPEPKLEVVKEESEVIILESKSQVESKANETQTQERKPYVASTPEPKPEVVAEKAMEKKSEIMDDDSDVEDEEKSHKTLFAFGAGVVIGAFITYLFL